MMAIIRTSSAICIPNQNMFAILDVYLHAAGSWIGPTRNPSSVLDSVGHEMQRTGSHHSFCRFKTCRHHAPAAATVLILGFFHSSLSAVFSRCMVQEWLRSPRVFILCNFQQPQNDMCENRLAESNVLGSAMRGWDRLQPASSQAVEVLGLQPALLVLYSSNMGTQIFLHQKQTHNLILAPYQIKRSTSHLQSVTLPEFAGIPAAACLDG
jgi:hypothetical protein